MLSKLIAALLLVSGLARADEFRIVVPTGPGSQPDLAARQVAQAFERHTGHQLRVEPVPGADTVIGVNHYKTTRADAIWVLPTTVVYNMVLKKELNYSDADFEHIIYIGSTPFFYIANINSKLKHPWDLRTYTPEFMGTNSTVGMANILALNQGLQTKIKEVNFKSAPELVTAVSNGTVDVGVIALTPVAVELTKAGKLSIIGTTHKSFTTADDIRVPSVSRHLGVTQFSASFGIAIRPGMNPDRAEILRRGLWKAVQDPESQEKFKKLFVTVDLSNDSGQITNHYIELRNYYKKLQNEKE